LVAKLPWPGQNAVAAGGDAVERLVPRRRAERVVAAVAHQRREQA
jgi:hypothetical protein